MLSRRQLLSTCAAAGTVIGLPPNVSAQTAASGAPAPGPFQLPPLPFAYDALEPYIDAETMHLHHDKHHAAYVANLNKALAAHPELQKSSVQELLLKIDSAPPDVRTAIRNQGGGHANHTLFWTTLGGKGPREPRGKLAADLDRAFGSFANFQKELSATSVSVFGSGWGWLVTEMGSLKVISTPNQDSPLLTGSWPVFGIDVWEHAYYLKYKNVRADYVKAIWNVLNWDSIGERYADHLKG